MRKKILLIVGLLLGVAAVYEFWPRDLRIVYFGPEPVFSVGNRNGASLFRCLRPRITDVHVAVDDVKFDGPIQVSAGNGKHGWIESASFLVPDGAHVVKFQARVSNGGFHYDVYQEWAKQVAPDGGRDYWRIEHTLVEH
jgi:hypothetical protein